MSKARLQTSTVHTPPPTTNPQDIGSFTYGDAFLKYHIYYPDNYYDSDTTFPLVLFLHGAGERGNDLSLVEKHGIPKMINNGEHFPFITIAPQCPKNQWWSEPLLLFQGQVRL